MSITNALLTVVNDCDIVCDTAKHRHASMADAVKLFGDEVAATPFIFCFTRPGSEIIESTFRLIERDLREGKLDQEIDNSWRAVLEHYQANNGIAPDSTVWRSLFGWMRNCKERPDSFFTGQRKEICVFDFHSLQRDWQIIRKRIGYDCLPQELPRLNGA